MVPWGTVDLDAFSVTRGELRQVRSSPDVVRGFCPACGTSLTYRRETRTDLDFALATLDEPEALRPERHLWVEETPSWVKISDGLPQYARSLTHAEPARAVRPGYTAVSARIVVDDPSGLVAFIQHVFEAHGQYTPGVPCELRIGDSTLLISEPGPRPSIGAFLYVYVPDVEATHTRALQRGAQELEAPRATPYGDRRSMIADPWDNTWQIARYGA
jgi:PhnB protein